jgi:UDP-GlcNAc:undecaprenyl-phosphate GlcNAc-1-phosphate transferase
LIGWIVLAATVPPAVISMLTLFPVRKHAVRLSLLDEPTGHSTHLRATPLGGGIGIWLGIVSTFAAGTLLVVYLEKSPERLTQLPESLLPYLQGAVSRMGQIWGLIASATILFLLGLRDDQKGVSPTVRLAVEFAVAAFVVYGLKFRLTAYIGLPWLTDCLSMVWIVGVINSFNMLDNMDGLSGGVAAIIAASMSVVMLTTPDPGTSQPQLFVAILLLVTFGSITGFLFHNRPPAKIFMGDAGSYLVGFLIAVSMLMATYAGNEVRPHAVLAPLCAMAVPLYDMSTVLWIRLREKRSLFVGDRSHFSHRLVDLGLSRTQAVLTIYLVTITCGLAAILMTHVSLFQAAMVLGIVVCMLLLIVILESTGWRKDKD